MGGVGDGAIGVDVVVVVGGVTVVGGDVSVGSVGGGVGVGVVVVVGGGGVGGVVGCCQPVFTSIPASSGQFRAQS